MPYLLEDLLIDRVDLVDEGANSAAFIELYKRKESKPMDLNGILSQLKPEHAEVVEKALSKAAEDTKAANDALEDVIKAKEAAEQNLSDTQAKLDEANDALAKANTELDTLKAKETCECDGEDEDGVCKVCGKPKKKAAFDETETLKSMPAEVRAIFEKEREKREAAENELRKAREAEAEAEAVAKAAELKSIPVEQEKLVGIIKSASPEVLEILTTANAAIESAVLGEVGKSHTDSGVDAWAAIDAKADEIVKRDSVTKQKAISIAIKENPQLYTEYLQGGAN